MFFLCIGVTSDFIVQVEDELDGSKKLTSVELTTDVTLERPTNVLYNEKLVVRSGYCSIQLITILQIKSLISFRKITHLDTYILKAI